MIFVGNVPNLEEILGACDLFLLPSNAESFGMAALEAMACEVPVIATDSGGLPEVVRHGETGYLCEVGDVEGMSQHAIEILSDPAKWESMSELGAEDARARFSLDAIVSQYEHLYRTSLAN
jgi:glycosyltransferase involved in cell wall biosynthesis